VTHLSKEFRIGVLVTAGLILLVLGVNYLKGSNPFQPSNGYFAKYDAIDGLAVSNPVLVNGFKVGQVTKVEFSEAGDGTLLVAFDIEESNLKLPDDTRARIFSSDLFGTKAIDLIAGESPNLAVPGDTLKAVFEADATLGLPTAFESIQRTVESLEQTSLQLDAMVAENRSTLSSIMKNVDGITTNFKNHNDELANVMENFSDISDSLAAVNFAATIGRADRSLAHVEEITRKIAAGQGSLGKLVNSDSLHDDLMATNQELQYLINDLYLNPWRYVRVSVFGKKQEKNLSKKEMIRLRNLIQEELEAQDDDNR
jgi:phospholipid/cholesterol/gamma-HCH transport system substrate-binding protein